jgi:two-component system, NarL family, nitrate/nitrite response regulator NarL
MQPTAAVAFEPAAAREFADLIRVLVVDDEPLFVEMVEVLLGTEPGIEIVGVAADGKEGVRLAAELEPDVIVMDISMPVMNGIDATREIRSHDPDARILILTGGASVDEIDDARAAGAAAYVTKDRIASDFVTELRELADR